MGELLIRRTEERDIPALVEIYGKARAFMRRTGNTRQWSDSYPSAESARADIATGCSYVCEDGGRVVATFFFKIGNDHTYNEIYDGEWLNDEPYGVIHRVASDGTHKGVMHKILDFCFMRIADIRIDTHRDNSVMQSSLRAYGFAYCGIIYLDSGDERLAFQQHRSDD